MRECVSAQAVSISFLLLLSFVFCHIWLGSTHHTPAFLGFLGALKVTRETQTELLPERHRVRMRKLTNI